ncbi:MAG: PilZ domain-containing protein [Phycisphaeraceae bacterium]|nr:MAG: PilZ domain-containing protein [Phycisphaeraceae bacterium]
MQRVSNDLWISLGPEDSDRLRYAPACGGDGHAILFRFQTDQSPPAPLAAGRDVLVFFNGPKGFMQQPARIVLTPENALYGLETTGDAVSAESREMFRVGVTLADYEAIVGGERCKVADVSVLGFAFLSDRGYKLGEVLEASFTLGGEEFEGRCRVKSVKPLAKGARFGLLCLNGDDAGNLELGLRKLTMEAQRTQLRRLSRAG